MVGAESDCPYFVVGRKDGILSLFRLEEKNDPEGEPGPQLVIQSTRTIPTGLAPIYHVSVSRSGIVVAGLSRRVGISFLFFDFTLEEELPGKPDDSFSALVVPRENP